MIAVLFGLSGLSAAAQLAALEGPTFSSGDRWEYLINGRLALEALGNISGEAVATGLTVARVSSITGNAATLTWSTDLTASGNLSFPNGEAGGIPFEGSIVMNREEELQTPYHLPLEIRDTTTFQLSINIGISVEYAATLAVEASVTPTESYPSYPLAAGELQVDFPVQVTSNLSVSFLGAEITNRSTADFDTELRIDVGPTEEVVVPAGIFEAVPVRTVLIEGLAPGPFQLLFPGSEQVAYYAEETGNPVLLEVHANGTEIGNAQLRNFSHSSQPPFWQQPVFLGLLLAVPAAILIYLYWRERRKGL